jgi:hypothetical protein
MRDKIKEITENIDVVVHHQAMKSNVVELMF